MVLKRMGFETPRLCAQMDSLGAAFSGLCFATPVWEIVCPTKSLFLRGFHGFCLRGPSAHPFGRKQSDLVLAVVVEAQNSYRVVPVVSMADRELLVLQYVGFPHLQGRNCGRCSIWRERCQGPQLHASFQILRKVLLVLSHDLEQLTLLNHSLLLFMHHFGYVFRSSYKLEGAW